MGRWSVVDEVAVADCAFDLEGESVADLFVTAAEALTELMVDPATVEVVTERRLTLRAPSVDLLLYDWLAELIFVKDSEGLVFTRVQVDVEPGSTWSLHATLSGGPIDRERTGLRADAKAVTFHQFRVQQDGDRWRARVVVDI